MTAPEIQSKLSGSDLSISLFRLVVLGVVEAAIVVVALRAENGRVGISVRSSCYRRLVQVRLALFEIAILATNEAEVVQKVELTLELGFSG